MRPAHPRRHGEPSGQHGLLTRLQGRRTDDRLRRSATLHHLNRRRRGQLERVIPDVLQLEAGLDHLVVRQRPQINQILINGQPSPTAKLGRLAGLALHWQNDPRDHCRENRETDGGRDQRIHPAPSDGGQTTRCLLSPMIHRPLHSCRAPPIARYVLRTIPGKRLRVNHAAGEGPR